MGSSLLCSLILHQETHFQNAFVPPHDLHLLLNRLHGRPQVDRQRLFQSFSIPGQVLQNPFDPIEFPVSEVFFNEFLQDEKLFFVFNFRQCLVEVLKGDFGDEFPKVNVEFEANDEEGTELLFGVQFREHFRHKVGSEFVWVEDFLSGGEGRDEEDSK